jgi:hypothetical protein
MGFLVRWQTEIDHRNHPVTPLSQLNVETKAYRLCRKLRYFQFSVATRICIRTWDYGQ